MGCIAGGEGGRTACCSVFGAASVEFFGFGPFLRGSRLSRFVGATVGDVVEALGVAEFEDVAGDVDGAPEAPPLFPLRDAFEPARERLPDMFLSRAGPTIVW